MKAEQAREMSVEELKGKEKEHEEKLKPYAEAIGNLTHEVQQYRQVFGAVPK